MGQKVLMKSQKLTSNVKQRNTPQSKIGMGDYLGTGVKQKMGRSISIMTESPAKKKMGKPPRSLA